MRAPLLALLPALCALLLPARAAPPERVIRVDPAQAGPQAGPQAAPQVSSQAPPPGAVRTVATLHQAADLVARWRARERGLRQDLRIVVEVAPGTHRLDRAVRLGPEHGGTAASPLVIRGTGAERPRILGSVALSPDPAGIDPGLLARAPAEARPHLRAYRLPPAALASPRIDAPRLLRGAPPLPALEVHDRLGALAPARWPNEGWARVARGAEEGGTAFEAEGAALRRWRGEADLWAEGYWRWDWLFEALPVAGLDAARSRLVLGGAPYEGIRDGARFRIAHALSELDRPGEWWRDRAGGRLLAWPRDEAGVIEVAVAESLFQLDGASHVRIEGLHLAQARGDLVTVRGGSGVALVRSALAWAGGRGAVFEGAAAGGLEGCEVADTGRAAVRLQGGDRATLAPGGLYLRDTRLTRYARLSPTQSPAVEVDGVGALISGNLIHDTDAYALHLRGNDHLVEWNEIARLIPGADDTGAVYAGRDWTARGTVIRHNFLHDVRAGPGGEVKGIYLDDMASGFTVRENLFLRVDQPVFIGGGRDNVVKRNLFVASSPAVHVDSRGEGSARDAVTDPLSEIRAALAAMPVDGPLWRARYPGLAGLLADAPGVAKGNRIVGNVFVESTPFRFDQGGRAELQTITGNAGPGGLRAASGASLAALAAASTRPADFEALVGAENRPLPRIADGRMRRALILDAAPGR